MPERLDLAQPLLALIVADPDDHAVDGGAHRRHAGEMQDVALEQFERVRAEVPAVEPARYAHRHYDARRFAFEDAPARPVVAALDRQQVGLQHALDEALHERRHVAAPERKGDSASPMFAGLFAIIPAPCPTDAQYPCSRGAW